MDEVVEIGPSNDETCARLRRALRSVDGFQLVLIEVEPGPVRTEVVRRIATWSARGDVAPLSIVRIPRGLPHADVMSIVLPRSGGSVVLDLDGVRGARQAMQALNWERDHLAQRLAGPLVLLLSRAGLQLLFEVAPDLVTWRKQSFRFPAPTRPRPPSPVPWIVDLARQYEWTGGEALAGNLATTSKRLPIYELIWCIRVRRWLRRFPEAEELLRLPRAHFSAVEVAWLDIAEVELAIDLDDPERAKRALQRAAATSVDSPYADRVRLDLALATGHAALHGGHADVEAQVAFETAARLAHHLPSRESQVLAAVGLAAVFALADDTPTAMKYLDEAGRLAEAALARWSTGADFYFDGPPNWLSYYIQCAQAWAVGPPESLRHLEAAYALAAATGGPEVVEVAVNAAAVALAIGDRAALARWLERAQAAGSDAAPATLRSAYWRVRGLAALRDGGPAARDALAHARAIDGFGDTATEAMLLAEAALAAGDAAAAARDYNRARELAAARADAASVALAQLGQGRAILAGTGRPVAEALAPLRAAIEEFAARGESAREAIARGYLGDALARRNDLAHAAADYRRAAAIFDSIAEASARDEMLTKATDAESLGRSQ